MSLLWKRSKQVSSLSPRSICNLVPLICSLVVSASNTDGVDAVVDPVVVVDERVAADAVAIFHSNEN